jgi:hypothetical protein
MSARTRGEHGTNWGRWQPHASRQGATAAARQVVAAATD